MPKSALRLALAAVCTVLLFAGLAQAGEAGAKSTSLKRVETKKVCMVNNAVFEKDQIPISVNGKTYYGCCEMCKERLGKDAAARTATDPVTGASVDKATAVIAAQADGTVFYFENEKTLARYEAGERKK